jgi:hypothetical protein
MNYYTSGISKYTDVYLFTFLSAYDRQLKKNQPVKDNNTTDWNNKVIGV